MHPNINFTDCNSYYNNDTKLIIDKQEFHTVDIGDNIMYDRQEFTIIEIHKITTSTEVKMKSDNKTYVVKVQR